MPLLFLLLFSLNSFAQSTDQIIGDLHWFPASELQPDNPLYQLAKKVGRLTTSRVYCTGWINSKTKIYAARHCLDPEMRAEIKFPLVGDGKYLLDKWVCNTANDVCQSTGDWNEKARAILLYNNGSSSHDKFYSGDSRDAFLIHVQQGEVLISNECTYWQDPLVFWRLRHDCDTLPGSSGGMLLNAETLEAVGLHTGAGLLHEYNVASKL